MRLVAYDPFVSADRARQMGVELVALDQLMAEADFVTIHLPKTTETIGLIGKDLLAKAKPDLRIINMARGGIVDEEALAEAIREGDRGRRRARRVRQRADHRVAAVRARPASSSRRTSGASTREAQDKAGRHDRREGPAGARPASSCRSRST